MKPVLPSLFAVTVMAALAVWWLSREPSLPLPDALTGAQIEALPEAQLVQAVTTDLRTRLQAAGATSGRWRSWPEPARHVLAWSWVEGDNGPGASPVFIGFSALLANRDRQLPTYGDIAAAYTALGASTPAAVLREAEGVAAGLSAPPEGTDPFAALNRRFVQTLGRPGTLAPMRAYIRTHTADLVAAR
ncbi:MAG: hypothetical protein L6R48_00065 [Planctomycetes bacterium]|nr:hypothetical protein [Planctomycetota bacterium]